MKTKIFYLIYGTICLAMSLFVACSNDSNEWNALVDRTEQSRSTTLEATITLSEVGMLDAALIEAVGEEDKYNVTKLTLSGPVNSNDIETLHQLINLEELDAKGMTWTWDEEPYNFMVRIWEGGSVDSVNEWLNDDKRISNYMFAGFKRLKKISLPNFATEIGYMAMGGCTALEEIELPEDLTSITYEAFGRTGIKELTIPSNVTYVSDGFCNYCNDLNAIYWDSSVNIPGCYDVENALVYVNNDEVIVSPSWKNVIRNGEAESIEIRAKDPWSGEDPYSFKAPKSFVAKNISYTRFFNNWTSFGGNGGWETIVLPFVPDSIYHETKGQIAPFNSGVETAKPFWLRSLTATGFVDVTAISANVPYIIAMPNNDRYHEEYRLNGWVTFVGTNVTIGQAVQNPVAVEGPDFSLQPTYEPVKQSNSIYSLNVRNGFGYENGSIFVRGGGDVRAFEAYAVIGGRSVKSLVEMDCSSDNTRTANETNKTGVPQIGDM